MEGGLHFIRFGTLITKEQLMILPTNQQPFYITLFGSPPSLPPSFTHSDDPEEAEVAFEASIFI